MEVYSYKNFEEEPVIKLGRNVSFFCQLWFLFFLHFLSLKYSFILVQHLLGCSPKHMTIDLAVYF